MLQVPGAENGGTHIEEPSTSQTSSPTSLKDGSPEPWEELTSKSGPHFQNEELGTTFSGLKLGLDARVPSSVTIRQGTHTHDLLMTACMHLGELCSCQCVISKLLRLRSSCSSGAISCAGLCKPFNLSALHIDFRSFRSCGSECVAHWSTGHLCCMLACHKDSQWLGSIVSNKLDTNFDESEGWSDRQCLLLTGNTCQEGPGVHRAYPKGYPTCPAFPLLILRWPRLPHLRSRLANPSSQLRSCPRPQCPWTTSSPLPRYFLPQACCFH